LSDEGNEVRKVSTELRGCIDEEPSKRHVDGEFDNPSTERSQAPLCIEESKVLEALPSSGDRKLRWRRNPASLLQLSGGESARCGAHENLVEFKPDDLRRVMLRCAMRLRK